MCVIPYKRAARPHGLPYRIAVSQMVRAYPPEKLDPSRPIFQGHARLSELTRIDRLWLPINVP